MPEVIRSPRWRWLQYRLRTLLVLCTLLAIALGWHRHRLQVRGEAIDAIVAAGGKVEYDYEIFQRLMPGRSQPLAYLRYKLGLVGPSSVLLKGTAVDDRFVQQRVLPLTSLKAIQLENVALTDAGLTQLRILSELQYLTWHRQQNQQVFSTIDQPTMIDFVDFPIADMLAYLSDLHRLKFAVDESDLGGNDQLFYTPITINLSNVSLNEALDRMLTPVGMGWVVGNGGLVIMSHETATHRKHQAAVDLLRAELPKLKVVAIDADVVDAIPLSGS